MLCGQIIAVCSQIHTKHINILCLQNVGNLNVKLALHVLTTKLTPLMHTLPSTALALNTQFLIPLCTVSILYIYTHTHTHTHMYVHAICVVLCSAGRHIAMVQLQTAEYC
jgi:hypothetical protein